MKPRRLAGEVCRRRTHHRVTVGTSSDRRGECRVDEFFIIGRFSLGPIEAHGESAAVVAVVRFGDLPLSSANEIEDLGECIGDTLSDSSAPPTVDQDEEWRARYLVVSPGRGRHDDWEGSPRSLLSHLRRTLQFGSLGGHDQADIVWQVFVRLHHGLPNPGTAAAARREKGDQREVVGTGHCERDGIARRRRARKIKHTD